MMNENTKAYIKGIDKLFTDNNFDYEYNEKCNGFEVYNNTDYFKATDLLKEYDFILEQDSITVGPKTWYCANIYAYGKYICSIGNVQ